MKKYHVQPFWHVFAKQLKYVIAIWAILFLSIAFPVKLFAQAPTISYSGPVAYAVGGAITPLTPISSGVSAPGYSNSTCTVGPAFAYLQGLAVDTSGNIYVAYEGSGSILEIPASGGPSVNIGSGFIGPWGVAVDAGGNNYM